MFYGMFLRRAFVVVDVHRSIMINDRKRYFHLYAKEVLSERFYQTAKGNRFKLVVLSMQNYGLYKFMAKVIDAAFMFA